MLFGKKTVNHLHSSRKPLVLSTLLFACLTACSSLKPPAMERSDRSAIEDRGAEDSGPPPEAIARADSSTIAILYSGGTPSQQSIAAAIEDALGNGSGHVYRIDIDAADDTATGEPAGRKPEIVAAIGPRALDVALRDFSDAAIVCSQVIDPDPAVIATRRVREIAPGPSPELLFAAWAAIDPDLKRIGLITSPTFAALVPEATRAATANGAELIHRVATSDREASYIFRRLAPEIDGLWLAPDSEILSTAMIDEMLAHAAELDIGVLVFSESLLDRGGLISVQASEQNVAGTVVDTIRGIQAGDAPTSPTRIPLREGRVRVNNEVAARLGLDPAMPTEWVIRDH